jgi:hypothetical protein
LVHTGELAPMQVLKNLPQGSTACTAGSLDST